MKKWSWGRYFFVFGFFALLIPIATVEKQHSLGALSWYSHAVESWNQGDEVGLKKISYVIKDSVLTLKVECQTINERVVSSKDFALSISNKSIFIHKSADNASNPIDRNKDHCSVNLPLGAIEFKKLENELQLSFPNAPLELFQTS